jgi:hypothetical protein
MISYLTNYMGPINIDWYRERGFTGTRVRPLNEYDISVREGRAQVGDPVEVEEVTVPCGGGRIDIYGLDESEYYGGMHEYSVPPMKMESWGRLTEWLDEFETKELWTFEQIIEEFERNNEPVEWIDDDRF